jgi:putative flippase GtrA
MLAVPAILAKMIGTLAGFLVNYGIRQFWVYSTIPRHEPVSVLVQRRKSENRVT